MCFSQFASYEPRPVKKTSGYIKKVSKMEHDDNYFGPKYYSDPIKDVEDAKAQDHSHEEINDISEGNVNGSVVKLANGKKILIIPLD